MNTAIELAVPPLELTATTPLEMQQSHAALIDWFSKKIEAVKFDAAELAENLAIAVKNKWKTSTLKRHADLAAKRVTYYEKIKAALEAGYCIVPNFPVTLFAIRTDRENPNRYYSTYQYDNWDQIPTLLPIGEGDHKSPTPEVFEEVARVENKPDGSKVEHKQYWAESWNEVDFPINMAKPQIMQATSRAMALKIFDEFGVLPDPHPKKDPMIVGHIVSPSGNSRFQGSKKFVSFVIAWHLNVRDL